MATVFLWSFALAQAKKFLHQLIRCLHTIRIFDDAIHRAYLFALRLIIMSHTLGTAVDIYLTYFFAQRNRLIRAFRNTYIATDTIFRYQ